jgi:hypothetical protein
MLSVIDANIPSSLLLLLVLAAALSVSLVSTILAAGREQQQPFLHHHTRNILLLTGGVYLGAILALRLSGGFDRLDVRALAPAFTVLWILLLVVLVQLKPVGIRQLIVQVMLWCCVIMFPVKGYTRFQESVDSWRLLGSPKYAANGSASYANFTLTEQANQTRKIFAGLAAADAVVVTDHPLVFEFLTGIRSLQLPDKIDINVISKFNELPAGSLILLPNDTRQMGLLKLRLDHSLIYEYLHLGKRIAVRTPIYVEPAGRS